MIYFIHGNETKKVREKVTSTIDALLAKQKDASVFKIDVGSWGESRMAELLGGQGLFLSKYIIVLNFISENKDYFEEMLKLLKEMKVSQHVCIIAEGELTKKNEEKIKGLAEKSQEYNLKKEGGESGVGGAAGKGSSFKNKEQPVFAFARAFANREFQKSEKYFQEFLETKIAAEEIHGVLWWQMKTVSLASRSHSAVSAGLNPFVFKNAKSASENWNPEDLDVVLNSLYEMYHLAHRGKIDFYNILERLIVRWGR